MRYFFLRELPVISALPLHKTNFSVCKKNPNNEHKANSYQKQLFLCYIDQCVQNKTKQP